MIPAWRGDRKRTELARSVGKQKGAVSYLSQACPTLHGIEVYTETAAMTRLRKRIAGLSLTELVCVIAIIAILASLYIGVITKAFARVVKFLKGF